MPSAVSGMRVQVQVCENVGIPADLVRCLFVVSPSNEKGRCSTSDSIVHEGPLTCVPGVNLPLNFIGGSECPYNFMRAARCAFEAENVNYWGFLGIWKGATWQ